MSDVRSPGVTGVSADTESSGFVRGLGLFDSTMIVVGSMIGSGIFIVSADIARHTGSTGGLLAAWVITGLLTVAAALSYGELAAMMPKAGGQYIYLREAYSPLWGFLYGWTLFLVIQTGTIAAVAVGFSRFLGVVWPAISPNTWIIPPIALSEKYAISLSVQQLVALLLILFLTLLNTRGLKLGKLIQNVFTSAKTLALAALILAGVFRWAECRGDSSQFQRHLGASRSADDRAGSGLAEIVHPVRYSGIGSVRPADRVRRFAGGIAIFRRCVEQHHIHRRRSEESKARHPRFARRGHRDRHYTLFSREFGLLSALPLHQIQTAPDDRVATATLAVIFGKSGATLMALAIMVSTFGCANGLILAGARVYYAMSRDGLFFRSIGKLNANHVPAMGLVLQGIWAAILVLLRTRLVDSATGAVRYGNLYGVLLDYVIFAALMFYVLTIGGVFVLRRKRPDADRPYRAWGYPLVPVLYIITATVIMLILILYQTQDTWPGLVIVLLGVPVYLLWSRRSGASGGMRA